MSTESRPTRTVARARYILLTLCALIISSAPQASSRIVWNVTASAPIGLYAVGSAQRIETGSWVIASLPGPVAALAVRRGYIGPGVPVLKQVAAQQGALVCGTGEAVFLNGRRIVDRRRFDRRGRRLPSWQGCRKLSADQVVLINAASAGSFDSRYFGPVDRDRLLGTAQPIWLVSPS